MTTTHVPSAGATQLTDRASETISAVPRLVADAVDASIVVFAPVTGDAVMVDLGARRSVFAAPSSLSVPMLQGSVSPGLMLEGVAVRAVQHVVASDQSLLGVIAVLDRTPRAASPGESAQLSELGRLIAGELRSYTVTREPAPRPAPPTYEPVDTYRAPTPTYEPVDTYRAPTPTPSGSAPASTAPAAPPRPAPTPATPTPRRAAADDTMVILPQRPTTSGASPVQASRPAPAPRIPAPSTPAPSAPAARHQPPPPQTQARTLPTPPTTQPEPAADYRWLDVPPKAARPIKDPTVPLSSILREANAATNLRPSLDTQWSQGTQPVTRGTQPVTQGDDTELRDRSLSLADEVAGAADSLSALLDHVERREDQVLHRHAAAVQERFAKVERSRARLRTHLEGNPARPRTRTMFDLPAVIDAAVAGVYQAHPGSRVDVDLIDDSLTVSADPGIVQRAVTMLLSSAVESSLDRTVRLGVGVRAEDSTSIEGRLSVQLTAWFSGEQLTAAQLARLAARFAEACHTSRRRRTAPPAQLRVTSFENVVHADAFEARSGREHTSFTAQWPLDLG
ncbi:hypothetical protein [Luteipulveratus mongoliensis]|uniref:Uncharacterized protein n=1 Tax=Luteipulveratus mongoliensis TaxID=571913 RepID=A0A0K1JL77_9MICO|nr:hypothetical protein [Luteipulveratus mongoliensis]AKU17477.1 hypothetical protein VV02_19225 [Luteipulveratus mongoliensis]